MVWRVGLTCGNTHAHGVSVAAVRVESLDRLPGPSEVLCMCFSNRLALGTTSLRSCTSGRLASLSGAEETSPMEGVTGTMAGLGHVPRWPRRGRYGHANNVNEFSDRAPTAVTCKRYLVSEI